ncbi:MAG TPA: hypothetical protein VGO13_04715 [Solirubrobacterales bacterium]|nr:hypothetical protein [Solirubrobacterales bacterium]
MFAKERTFVTLADSPGRQTNSKGFIFMADTKNGSKSKTQAKRATTEAKKSATSTAKATKRAATKTVAAEKNQVQTVAEAAVDVPVGIVLSVSDRVSDIVEPWTGRASAEKQLKSYRTQLRKTVKRTERRGTSARRKATTEARKTRNRVEREARKHQRTVETTLKRNRNEVESRVRRAIDAPASRAQGLVDQVTDQLASLR